MKFLKISSRKIILEWIHSYKIHRLEKLTQINNKIDIFEDRKNELAEYYKTSPKVITDIFMGENKHELFEDVSSDIKLFKAYKKRKKIATISHMLKYHRFEQVYYLLNFFNTLYPPEQRNEINILDYGCSIADFGLAFALYGYNVLLCDINDGNIEMGKWRFKKRNLKYSSISIDVKELYPEFNELDIVIASEVLEHIRNPLIALQNIFKGLNHDKHKGYLWVSGYPIIEAKIGPQHPDHLEEAFYMRNDVLSFLQSKFVKIKIKKGFLFQKLQTNADKTLSQD